jgi:phosphatidylserine decarboxylase
VYSHVVGATARIPIPRPLRKGALGAFARAVGADVSEADQALDAYGSVSDFFARRLRSGLRPIHEDPRAVVSPADGVVSAAGTCDGDTLVQAKGRDYRIDELVADGDLARRLRGGQFVTVYLSPRDYHRVHSPVAGSLLFYHYIPGSLWPVSPWYQRTIPSLYARNERAVIAIETADGPVVVVLVGAAGVGNLWLSQVQAPGRLGEETRGLRPGGEPRRFIANTAIDRGDELGAFQLGSTVVVLFPAGVTEVDTQVGARLFCGQRIGQLIRSSS